MKLPWHSHIDVFGYLNLNMFLVNKNSRNSMIWVWHFLEGKHWFSGLSEHVGKIGETLPATFDDTWGKKNQKNTSKKYPLTYPTSIGYMSRIRIILETMDVCLALSSLFHHGDPVMKIPIEETIEGFRIRGYSWWLPSGK